MFETIITHRLLRFVCSYFQDVLQSPLLSTDDNEIQLHQDGSWSTHVEKNGSCSVESPQKPVGSHKVEVISLDLDASIEASSQHLVQSNMLKMCLRANGGGAGDQTAANGSSSGVANGTGGDQQQQPSNDTVDLTLSDSDDDDDPQKRPAGKK